MSGRTRLLILLTILVALGGCYAYLLATKRVPCVTPITYSLVAYDERFGIPQDEIESDIAQAAAVWNKALGRNVFVESSTPDLPVSFAYNSAQHSIDTVASLNNDIDALRAQQNEIAKQYAATKDPALIDTFYMLRDQIIADEAKERSIAQSSEIQEGRYVSDQEGTRIYVYGFKNKTELMRVLTHEFGHALGLDHVAIPDSIMYASIAGTNLALTPEDKAELARACSAR
jgi:hypothetical protein